MKIMKILLVSVDAKFIHTNLAVHSLKSYSNKYKEYIEIAQYSINHTKEEILRGIYLQKADIVAFSCYIWNIDIISNIIESLRKIQPQVKIWFGGPEVSYNAKDCLFKYKELDGIVIGEGEQTFYELIEYYIGIGKGLEDIQGIAYKDRAKLKTLANINMDKDDDIAITPPRGFISMDDIPFAYTDIEDQKNKIIYYESSRGCPYSCSYCLSSAHKGVRFRSISLVKEDLSILLDYKVAQVKFVDRTFNCNKEHAMEIWRFIKEHDNGITNFHFEITADLLSEEELSILASLRPGLVQLEIGVQTTNQATMEAIRRKVDFKKLSLNVKRIKNANNIHQHLDLIAGLPMEDYDSFEKSFQDVYRLKPDQLQLGFLKVLKGSIIEEECKEYGIVYNNEPPYEVLYTKYLSFDDIIELKGICDMVEVYYNSGQFAHSIEFLEHYFDSPMKLYASLYHYYVEKGLYTLAHSRIMRYEILIKYFKETIIDDNIEKTKVFEEILLFDLCLREALRNRPNYVSEPIPYKEYRLICDKYRINRAKIHLEKFSYDVKESARQGQAVKNECIILFDYDNRDPITNSASIQIINDYN